MLWLTYLQGYNRENMTMSRSEKVIVLPVFIFAQNARHTVVTGISETPNFLVQN